MKSIINKTLIGILFLTSICASSLTMNDTTHSHKSGHTEVSNQMQSENLACCESHEKEAGLTLSPLTSNDEGKSKITQFHQTPTTEIIATRSSIISSAPSPPPDHKYLASVIRLE